MSAEQASEYECVYEGTVQCPRSGQAISWAVNRYVGPNESRRLSEPEFVDLVGRISMTGWLCDCSLSSNNPSEPPQQHSLFTPSWLYSVQTLTDLMSSTPEATLNLLCSAHTVDGHPHMRIYRTSTEMHNRARKVTARDKQVPDFTLIALDERMLTEEQCLAARGLAARLFLSVNPSGTATSIPLVTLPIEYPKRSKNLGKSMAFLDCPRRIPVALDWGTICPLE